MNKSVKKSIFKNSLYRGTLSFFNLIVPMLVVPYVYRVLSPALIGGIEYTTSIFDYFNLLGVLGIYTYGLREASKVRDFTESVKTLYHNLFVIGVCSNLLVLLIYLTFAFIGFHTSPLFLLMLMFCGNFIANIFYTEWINEAYEDFKFIAIKTIIVRVLYAFSIWFFVKEQNDVYIYVFLIVFFNFINYFAGFVYSRRYTQFSLLRKSNVSLSFKKYISPLFFILILNNSSVFYTLLDRVMLGTVDGSESVAYYSVGQKIMEIVRSLLLTLTLVSLPRLSYYLENDYDSYVVNLSRLLGVVLMIAIPMSIGLFVLSDSIVYFFAGPQYSLAVLPLSVFSFRILTLMIENITAQQIMFLHGKEKLLALFNVCFGILNFLFNMVLVYVGMFTPFTAILSTFLVECALLLVEILYIKKRFNLSLNIITKSHLNYIFLSVLFFPIAYLINHIIVNVLFASMLTILLCMSIYCVGLYKLKDKNFIEMFLKLKKCV